MLLNLFRQLKYFKGRLHFFIYAVLDGNCNRIALPQLFKAAECGYTRGQSELGTRYLTGELLKKNYPEAQKWLELSSKKGSVFSLRNLAVIYYYGLNDEQSYLKAFEIWAQGAEKGDVKCQFYIAEMYQDGVGVEKDINQAINWYKKSATQGYAPAKDALNEIFSK